MRMCSSLAVVGLVGVLTASATAQVAWNEALQGDLSGNRLAPTQVVLAAGTQSLLATTGRGDLEYVTFTVPAGMELTQLNHISYQGPDPVAFIGIQAGPIITQTPQDQDPTTLLGWTHFGGGTIGDDILDDLGTGGGAIGFTPPLPSGTYALWLQQLGAAATYQLDFVVVPAPGALCIVAGAGLIGLRRRR